MSTPAAEHRVEELRQVALPLARVRAQVQPGLGQPVPDTRHLVRPPVVRSAIVAGGRGGGLPVSRSSTLMLPRVAREYGQTWWAASTSSLACSGGTFGRSLSSVTTRSKASPSGPMPT